MITYNIFPRYTIPKSCFRSQQDTIPNDGEIYADYILQVAKSGIGRWDGGGSQLGRMTPKKHHVGLGWPKHTAHIITGLSHPKIMYLEALRRGTTSKTMSNPRIIHSPRFRVGRITVQTPETKSTTVKSILTWATAEVGVMREKLEETAPEPADCKASWVSLRWSSQVVAALDSRSPECCLAVHVPEVWCTIKVKTAIAAACLVSAEGVKP